MIKPLSLVLLAVTLGASTAAGAAQRPGHVERTADGIVVRVGDAFLELEVCSADVIRVAYAKDRAFFDRRSLATGVRRKVAVKWTAKTGPREVEVATPKLTARADLATGAVSFFDARGNRILAERPGGRALTPADVQGEKTFNVRQVWEPNEGESLYGLGQHQLGLMDLKGYDVELWQHNGTIAIPFLVSSRGYGILWDNTSETRFGDLRPFEPIPAARLRDASGTAGGLTGSYFAGANFEKLVATRVDPTIDVEVPSGEKEPNPRIHPALPPTGEVSVRWEGEVAPETTGDYTFRTFSNNGVRVWIDGRMVIDHWRQGWLPWWDVARVRLEAGRKVPIRVEWWKDQGMETVKLLWKTPPADAATSLWSEVGDGLDYYVVYGPDLDDVVAGYRRLTGGTPMMPKWAFGLWQSRQRYNTQQESLAVLDEYRRRRIPIDVIVQDWFYWKEDQWGSHEFDPARFPDPEGWVKAVHERNAKVMISVWPKFYPGTKHFDALQAAGALYQPNLREKVIDWLGHPDTFYDAFSEEGRRLYWSQMKEKLFAKGFDAWWMDATEPDLLPTPILEQQKTHVHPTAMGTGSRVLNAYPLVHSRGVYEGQRAAAPDRRVFILTRSAFAGMQRYAAAVWSGDISSTWQAMRKQIPAGLGYSLSGMPYWSMDIGGFSVPSRFARKDARPEDVEEWRELNARWFQFGTFVPLTRLHGEAPFREPWEFGGEGHPAAEAVVAFDRLRYRMLPYVYSLAGDVTHADGTIMRPLVMDFREDATARQVGDEYMFGPALLVAPVTEYKARGRRVYLPATAGGWYDFWTGAAAAGGTVEAAAPLDRIPVYVRAGSIVPLGPELQYTTEKPADPVTLYVYTGADGAFALYEDDGLTYGYEKGAFARIPVRWDERTRTLTIGRREGSFPGMLAERTFRVVPVSKDAPAFFTPGAPAGREVRYRGEAVTVRLPGGGTGGAR